MKKILFAVAILLASKAAFADETKGEKHHHHGEEMGEKFFAHFDKNSDGTITQAEWKAANDAKFKEIDTNGDKKITKEEMKAEGEKMREKFKAEREKNKEEKTSDKKAEKKSDKESKE